MRNIVTLALICFLITGCKKSTCSYSGSDQGSYTQTDANGTVMATPDPKDWTTDANWNSCENELFDFTDTFNYQILTASSTGTIIAFPNPFTGQFVFHATDTGNAVVKLIIVDDKLNILGRNTISSMGSINELLSPIGLSSNSSYRLYYRIYGPNKSVLTQGHGDLRTN